MNDYANALGADERGRLERVLEEGERATGAQVVLAVFRSLEGESLEDFAIRLAERWRVGRKGLDDGAIVLVFLNDRKVRIEVGYGLEGAIPDVEASRIIRETITPRFREGRYAAGLEAASRAIYARVDGTPVAERPRGARGSTFPFWGVFGFVAIILVIAAMLMREAATTRGFVRRGYTARHGGWGAPPVIFFPPMGGGGRHGGGGGGGFSGGGGSFGGGGASGDW